jgi:4'-phosphopantetheinyl transferase
MLALAPGQIDVWLTFTDDVCHSPLIERYRRLLTPDERQREQRLRFAKDQRRYLITRALVRATLSRYVPVAAQDVVFTDDAFGKPRVASIGAEWLSFSVSHTDSLIVLGVTIDRAFGVDTENVRVREACLDVADRFFAADEMRALIELPPDQRSERLFEYWTLKESHIKARGMGLSIPLDQFSVMLPAADRIVLSVQSTLSDRASRWQFWHCRPSAAHIVAVCAERLESGIQQVRATRVVPLGAETACDLRVLRQSR